MAYPDFSELSFGYCFLRELESRYTHGGRFPKAPDFITQHDEATKGYDVEVAMDGAVPLFIQLKRSEVMVGGYAREFGSQWFQTRPAFRMNLHGKHAYAQHAALQDLDTSGEQVIYATSQIEEPAELSAHSVSGTVISSASAMFAPNEIQLPDLTAKHHVSFYEDKPWAVVFSEEGGHFDRRFPSAEKWISQLFEKPRGREENEAAMRSVALRIRSRFGASAVDRGIARISDGSPVTEAAILSYFLLDAQLTFVKPPKKRG
jgi:hypothetical protein